MQSRNPDGLGKRGQNSNDARLVVDYRSNPQGSPFPWVVRDCPNATPLRLASIALLVKMPHPKRPKLIGQPESRTTAVLLPGLASGTSLTPRVVSDNLQTLVGRRQSSGVGSFATSFRENAKSRAAWKIRLLP